MMNRIVLFLLLLAKPPLLLANNITIGGLFDMADSVEEVAFRYAVDQINKNNRILPRSMLMVQIERIPHQDSFYAAKRACHSIGLGVAALFGPKSGAVASHIQSICDAKKIPHIETRWDSNQPDIKNDFSINLHPYPLALSNAYVGLVEAMGWKDFVVLYEDNEGLLRLQDLIKLPSESKDVVVNIRQILPGPTKDYRTLMKDLKKIGVTNIILDCSTENIVEILKQAQQVGMMTAYHNYIITNLDLHMVELEDFKYGGTTITAMRLVDPQNKKVQEVLGEWRNGQTYFKFGEKSIRTETALLYDATLLFAQALSDLHHSQDIQTAVLTCDGEDTWKHGNSLINYMKMVEMEGLSGKIKFDASGYRSKFSLDIVELKKEGLVCVGKWDSLLGANFSHNYTQQISEIQESLHNKTLKITTILNSPYTMMNWDLDQPVGNDRYEGFNIDLIKEISKVLGFTYNIQLVKDGKYGSKSTTTQKWDGLIGELLERQVDLAVADLTITSKREKAVDFTMPYMNLGITLLYKKPTKYHPNMFSFLSPLSFYVWMYIITAYCMVSLLMYLLAKLSPYEKKSSEASPEPTFTLMNSFWFTLASLFRQKVEITPSANSTRMIAGLWWFFTLVMISSYVANLAAFLTVERMESPIESADDLANQRKIKYGTVKGGSTAAFFKDSHISTYAKMWSFMDQHKSVFVNSNREGVDRVREGDYAFMTESTTVEYVVERQCDLMQLGGLLDNKGYGIALPPNSPFRTPISNAILQLQEKGILHKLKQKWWMERKGGGKCSTVSDEKGANSLGIENVAGIFVVLLVGLGLSSIIAIAEFCWQRYTTKKEKK